LRVWTIQPAAVYEKLKAEGVFRCDPMHPECFAALGFYRAYDWLAGQMRQRIGGPPDGVRYPIWAWYAMYGKNRRPDLRWIEFRAQSAGYCIELEIPDADVLLSDAEGWYIVLNDGYYPSANDSFDAEYQEWELLPDVDRERIKIDSWDRVFDVFNEKTPCEFIQATFWEMRIEQVIQIRYFRGWIEQY